MRHNRKSFRDNDVAATMRSCRQHLAYGFVFNGLVSILMLAYPIFMVQMSERVVPARSFETLVALLVGFVIAMFAKAIFQWVRSILFIRASQRIEARLGDRLFDVMVRRAGSGQGESHAQHLRDLDSYRQFTTGRGALAVMDAPWGLFFLGVMLVVDLALGVTAMICMAILTLLTIANSALTKDPLLTANRRSMQSYLFADSVLRSAEAVVGMGMIDAVGRRWRRQRNAAIDAQGHASRWAAFFMSISASSRMFMQGALLAVGAVQAIRGEVPFGVVFACLFVFQFAMRPIEQLIAAGEEYWTVRDGMQRVDAILASDKVAPDGVRLPRPQGRLSCQDVSFVPRGAEKPILRSVGFTVQPGMSLGLVGLNGAGKTTLARILVGSLAPSSGTVRLDGADLATWNRDDLGRHVGYLPQMISLLPGTVGENIGRFGTNSDEEIIAAAKLAGAHEMILRLPRGYETEVGDTGFLLSGGQRQLIGLARAVVGNPALVVLDEPNSNLDGPGEEALLACLKGLKEQGTTVVMITHRPNLVANLDQAAVLRDGVLISFGSTEDVFRKIGRPMVVKKVASNDE
jgi:PrtD family type I secretion system ABC transporter